MRWRTLISPAGPAALNMALDHALLERAARTGEATFRVYGWETPTLSLGRNQVARDLYSAERAAELGVRIVRRPTGGRALLHWREVTYSVAAPAVPAGGLRESYARINRLLLDGLRRLGVHAEFARPAGRAPLPGDAPCFEIPVEGELVLGGRKLVGSAQWRDRGALLQHGSILVDDDQPMLARLASRPIPPAPPAATLREALGRPPSTCEVAEALFAAVGALEDESASAIADEDALHDVARERAIQYEDERWTWRR
jgi:lipoate-protein ligase A